MMCFPRPSNGEAGVFRPCLPETGKLYLIHPGPGDKDLAQIPILFAEIFLTLCTMASKIGLEWYVLAPRFGVGVC